MNDKLSYTLVVVLGITIPVTVLLGVLMWRGSDKSEPSPRIEQTETPKPKPKPKPVVKTTECVDVTSYDYNWQNDMLCTRPDGSQFYTDYAGASQYD